ncbi:MAG TPA: hypothetical protein VH479_01180 [Acidimicrobiales bacterium]
MSVAVKVVRFHAGGPSRAEALAAGWAQALDRAPAAGRPVRVTLGVPLVVSGLPAPRFAAVDCQWFGDAGEADANEGWLRAAGPDLAASPGSLRVVAEEVVLRGEDWLDARWAAGGERYKMMSCGRRDPALAAGELSTRWRKEAGRLGAEEIPEAVRGQAYAQNHPLALDGAERPLDAVNEVWFDRLADLRRRGAWFAARPDAGRPLWVETWSLYLREIVPAVTR